MLAMQSALNFIIKMQGISVTLQLKSDASEHVIDAAQSNYFRQPLIDENITGQGRSYVISAKDLTIIPKRGDSFIVSNTEYYGIANVQEMRAFGNILGYRLFLE